MHKFSLTLLILTMKSREGPRVLLSDYLVDSLNLRTTDELLNEIDRSQDPERRREGRDRIQLFPHVDLFAIVVCATLYESLRGILPHRTASQDSDVRHLAKAASSDVNVFVTRDQAIQRKAQAIADLTNLRVLSPTELIIELHELNEGTAL